LSREAWILYAVLFLWQFPHFMAIAWMYREDYLNPDPNGRCVRRNGRTFLEGHLESMVTELRDDAEEALRKGSFAESDLSRSKTF
jgi:hypothetical protein